MLLRLLSLQKFIGRNKTYDTLPKPFGADLRGLGPVHACTCHDKSFFHKGWDQPGQ